MIHRFYTLRYVFLNEIFEDPSFKSEQGIQTQCDMVQGPRSGVVAHNSKGCMGAVHSSRQRKSGKPDLASPLCLYYLPPRKARHLSNTSLCPPTVSQQRRGSIHVCGLNETQAGPVLY